MGSRQGFTGRFRSEFVPVNGITVHAVVGGHGPPLLMDPATDEFLWHFAFNRLADVNERMVAGREEVYFGHQFASKAASPTAVPQEALLAFLR